MKNSNKFKFVVFFLITLMFKPLWLFNNQNLGNPGDDMSYWLHASTLAFDYDLKYINDYSINSDIFNPETNAPQHPPGAGYLASPFVLLLNQFDKAFIGSVKTTRTNPVKSFAYIGFFLSGLFYVYIGSYLLSKVIKRFKNKYSGLIIFCGLISTLIHFVSTRFLMAHAIEFFLCSVLLFIFEKDEEKKLSNLDLILLFLTYFLLLITRPSTFLYSIILVFLYRHKFIISKKSLIISLLQVIVYLNIYKFLSNKLYQNNYMFLNAYGNNMDEYSTDFNFEQIFSGILKLPNFFLSTNMGVIFSTPIVFIAIILFITKYLKMQSKPLDKIIFILFFTAGLLPVLIWQGREVAYGQRLLIGLLPICILIACKYLTNFYLAMFAKILTFYTYLGYLFFYSSESLTLRKGITLWGTEVGFTAENYYFELLKALFNYETIISMLLRNIYSVNFFKFLNLREFVVNSSISNSLNIQKIEKFLSYSDTYLNLELSYLIVVNLVIFIFSYLYTKLIFETIN